MTQKRKNEKKFIARCGTPLEFAECNRRGRRWNLIAVAIYMNLLLVRHKVFLQLLFKTVSTSEAPLVNMKHALQLSFLLTGSLALSFEQQPSLIKFVSPSTISPDSAQNIRIEYLGDVNGELSIAYGPCATNASLASATQHIGSTHVGTHPHARRHADYEGRHPTKFVWVTPQALDRGCLQALVDGQLVSQSDELVIKKRLVRRATRTSFAEIAGEDSLWFNGVAYLKQKQPDDTFVSAVKSKSFGILGGGMSGLATSVSLLVPPPRGLLF